MQIVLLFAYMYDFLFNEKLYAVEEAPCILACHVFRYIHISDMTLPVKTVHHKYSIPKVDAILFY